MARETGLPHTDDGPVLHLFDVRHQVEADHLATWISTTQGAQPGGRPRTTTVDLEQPSERSASEFERVLEDPSLTVQPLRLAWIPEGGSGRTGPRLRDLMLGDPRHPGSLMARLVLQRHPERARPVVGAPAAVAELRRRYEEHLDRSDDSAETFGAFVLRMAGISLDVAERTFQGRRYKVPRYVGPGVASSPGFQHAVSSMANRLERPVADVTAEARRHLTEMVATPSTFFIDWTGTVTRWIVSLAYQEVVVDPVALARARAMVRDHPSALLWSHKSHVDGIALLSVLYENDFPAPHSMGGMNMAFGGVGFLGRRAGIIFIRRSFSDEPVYKLALQQYLGYLMDKRFPFSWAFEGTRSRNGKLMPPRYGLLKYVVDGAHATRTRDLHLIPVSISYDLVGEAGEYAMQEAGGAKQAESIGWFVQYLRRLRSPMGKVYVDFAEPVVLEGEAPASEPAELSRIAFEVARRVNAQVPVTLPALMCMALLGAAPRALTVRELDVRLRALIGWLQERDVRMASSFDVDDAPALEELAGLLFERGLIDRSDDTPDRVFSIGQGQFPVAGYYRNTIAHYFVDRSIAELALLATATVPAPGRVEAFEAEARWLRDALKFEFFHTPSDRFIAGLDNEIAAANPRWKQAITGDHADVEALLRAMSPLVAHSVLMPYIDAYGVVAEVFARLDPTETLDEKSCLTRALAMGEQMVRQQRISTRASIGRQMFKGAYSLMTDKGLVEPGGPEVARARRELTDRFEKLAGRLTKIRTLALAELSIGADPAPTGSGG